MTERDDPFHDLGYTTSEEAQALRSAAPSYPEDLHETRRVPHRRRRSGNGPQRGEEEIPVQPLPDLNEQQQAINRDGAQRLHPGIDIILERQMLDKAGGDSTLAAIMLRAYFERMKKPQ